MVVRNNPPCSRSINLTKTKHMPKSGSIKREMFLIFFGAIISLSTAFLTNLYNAQREDNRYKRSIEREEKVALVKKRIEITEDLSKDLGKRFYFTVKLYNRNRKVNVSDKDLTVNEPSSIYSKSQEEWNINKYLYQAQLIHYFSSKINEEFIDSIYNPMISLGNDAENRIANNLLASSVGVDSIKKRDEKFYYYDSVQRIKNVVFITKLYNLVDK
jgi:hypothetical protein